MNTVRKFFHTWPLRYGFAVILVAVATWLCQLMRESLGNPPLYLLFYPASIIAASLFGLGPGLVATLLSAASAAYFFLSPVGQFKIVNTNDAVGMAVFVLMSLAINLLAESAKRGRAQIAEKLRLVDAYNRSLIDTSLDPLLSIGPDGNITDVNAATVAMTGYPRDALIGTEFTLYFAEPTAALAGYQEVFRVGTVRDYALEFRHRDGHLTPVLFNAAAFRDEAGKVVGICAVARDISERKRAEQKALRLSEIIERRVVERTAQLQAANQELEAFSYSVSHDLRSPLRAIDGFSRMIEKKYSGQLDDEGKRLIQVVRDNTARMSQLIDDILAFSRTGRLEIKDISIDMEQLARHVWQELEPSWAGRDVQLEVKPLQPVHGDLPMLKQVMVNLLENAIKFTRPHASARIEIGNQIDGEETVYYVKDNGVGFEQQYAHKLFGVFQRLHDMTAFEGTGIGLAIVKRVITRHGGRVWAEGRENEGATVYFALPK